jgi:N-acetylmuramoyl-L-alanine amidase
VAPDEQPALESQGTPYVAQAFPTIILDPGHGGRDEGAQSQGLVEKDLTLDLAQRIESILQPFGFPTMLTRRDNEFVSLAERAAMANRVENALYISLHFNHASPSASTGVETFYASSKVAPESAWTWIGFFNKAEPVVSDNGETLAGFIQASLVMRTDATNRGIKGRELYVVRHTRCPAVLVEAGFISNPLEARLIANPEYRDRLARAIAEGVMSYQKTRPRRSSPTKLALN